MKTSCRCLRLAIWIDETNMRHKLWISNVVVIFGLLLLGCNTAIQPSAIPNNVYVASETPRPSTTTPIPSSTHTPTPGVEPLPQITLPAQITSRTSTINADNFQQLEIVAKLGHGIAYDFSWSPNDVVFTINSSIGLYIYASKTWEPLKKLEAVDSYKWSPDGTLFAATTNAEPNSIQVYDGRSFEKLRTIKNEGQYGWSPNGEWLATAESSAICLYSTDSFDKKLTINTGNPIWRFSFSPDGKTLATLDGQVKIWDTTTGRLVRKLDGNQNEIDSVIDFVFSPDGKMLLVLGSYDGGFDFIIEVWNTENGQNIYSRQDFVGYSYAVDSAFSPDSGQIALAVYKTITIIDSETGEIIRSLNTNDIDEYIDSTVKIAYTADGSQLITTAGIFNTNTGVRSTMPGLPEFEISSNGIVATTGARDSLEQGSIQLWDATTSQIVKTLPGQYNWIYSVSFSKDGRFFASFDERANVQIHEVATGSQTKLIEFDSEIYDMAFGPITKFSSGYLLATSDDLGEINIWDTGNEMLINSFFGDGGKNETTNPVALSPNGQLLAYHEHEGYAIIIMDASSGVILRRLTPVDPWTQRLVFSPDGMLLVSGSSNYNRLYSWDLEAGSLLNEIDGNSYDFAAIPNTNHVAWGYGNSIQIWDLITNKSTATLTKTEPGVEEWYLSVASSSDGRLLAAGTSNGLIDIWDLQTNKILRTLEGHGTVLAGHDMIPMADIESIDFNPSGDLLASAGIDCSVRLWNINTGKLLKVYSGCGPVAFSPDGIFLAYAAADKTVTLMGIP